MIVANNPNRIINPNSKAASTQEYQTVVTAYDMGGSSSSDNIVYKCGTHDYETKNLNEFNNHIATHTHNESKAASGMEEAPSIIEGVPHYTVNKVKEIFDFMASNGKINEPQPKTVSKAASAEVTNEVRELFDFVSSGGRSVLNDYGGSNPQKSRSKAANTSEPVNEVKEIYDFMHDRF